MPHDFDEPRTRPLDAAIMGRMWQYMRPYRRGIYFNLFLATTAVLLELIPPRLAKHIIDVNIARGDRVGLALSIGVLLLTAVGIMAVWRVHIGRVVRVGEQVMFDLRQAIFQHLQRLSMNYYDRMKVGRIIARGTSDMTAMRSTVVWALPRIVGVLLTLLGTLVMMFLLSRPLFWATCVVVPLLSVANYWFRKRVSVAWRKVREIQSRIVASLAENINGMRVIQAYAREEKNLASFQELQQENYDRNMRAAWLVGIYMPSLDVIGAIGKSIILLYGGYLAWNGQVAIGTLVAFVMYHELLFGPIRELGDIYNEALHAMAGGERIFTLLEEKPAVFDRTGAKPMPRINGRVRFEHVTFGYDPRYPVLRDISFEALAGQAVALVGPTGAGKSSIVKLVARFYDIQQGHILIDGQSIGEVTLESLHRQMGMVSQMNFLFSGTLADNIRYACPEAMDEQVIAAATVMGSHEVFAKLPDGYRTTISERGESLSLGQRQLVCLTRAFLADPRIFIFDEATSAIDPETETRIQHALTRLLQGRTSFIIAHRLSTIRHADLVLVIDGGRIIERGTHDSLLEKNGRYYQLYQEFIRTT